jgi:hypothetical protein
LVVAVLERLQVVALVDIFIELTTFFQAEHKQSL